MTPITIVKYVTMILYIQIFVYPNTGVNHGEADFCAALSEPTRIFILYALNEHPFNVTELTNELGIPQPTTSRHLKILRERGLVFTKRQGTVVTYHLADKRIIQALDLLRAAMRDRMTQQANLMEEAYIERQAQ